MVFVDPRTNEIVAHLSGVVAAVAAEAAEAGARAEGILRAHFHTGASSIEVTHGDVDSWVSLVDDAAVSIEFGRTGARDQGTSQGVFPVWEAFGIRK